MNYSATTEVIMGKVLRWSYEREEWTQLAVDPTSVKGIQNQFARQPIFTSYHCDEKKNGATNLSGQNPHPLKPSTLLQDPHIRLLVYDTPSLQAKPYSY